MIIYRYIAREVFLALLAVLSVLLLVFLSSRFVQYLGEVVGGGVPRDIILVLLGLKALNQLVVILPLAFYLAVLLTLSRMYRDSEVTALRASGVGTRTLVQVVLLVSPAVALPVAALSLYAAPWAAERDYQLREQAARASELQGVAAGQFRESRGGALVYYVERLSADRTKMQNVFLHSRQGSRPGVLSSDAAHMYTDPVTGDQFVVMTDGFRYEGEPGAADYRIVQFEKYAVRIKESAAETLHRKHYAIPTAELWGSRQGSDVAELQWRISMPLAAVLLALLAVPLSRASPREGRFARLFIAFLVYVIYNNLMGVARDLVKTGAVSPLVGMWWVHLLLLGVALALLAHQIGPGWVYRRLVGRGAAGTRS